MAKYQCDICNTVFQRNANLKYHLTQKVCYNYINNADGIANVNNNANNENIGGNNVDGNNVDGNNDGGNNNDGNNNDGNNNDGNNNDDGAFAIGDTYICKFCNKRLASRPSLSRHIHHTCKIKKADDDKKNNILDELVRLKEESKNKDKKIIQLQQKIKKSRNKAKDVQLVSVNNVANDTHNGNINDNITNDVVAIMISNMAKNITGHMTGSATGVMTGNMTCNMTGDMTGETSGNVPSNEIFNNIILGRLIKLERDNQMLQEENRLFKEKNKKKNKRKIDFRVRQNVWNKYIGESIAKSKCYCCKMTDISMFNFNCGHVISVHDGGTIDIENLRPICQTCNLSMGTQNMFEYIKEHGLHK